MAVIRVAGTVQLTKTGSNAVVTLWEKTLNQRTGLDQKTAYKLWLPVPGDWTDGTWVEVEGTLSVRASMNQDGTPRTYVNAAGHTITSHDLNINDITIKQAKVNQPAGYENVDLDDVRKYGQPGTPLDESPF